GAERLAGGRVERGEPTQGRGRHSGRSVVAGHRGGGSGRDAEGMAAASPLGGEYRGRRSGFPAAPAGGVSGPADWRGGLGKRRRPDPAGHCRLIRLAGSCQIYNTDWDKQVKEDGVTRSDGARVGEMPGPAGVLLPPQLAVFMMPTAHSD